MALVVNSEMPSNVGEGVDAPPSSSPGPWTFSFDNVAGTVLYVFIGIGALGTEVAITFTGCTYNGVAMTEIATMTTNGANGGRIVCYRLLSPATGSNTVSVSYSGTISGNTRIWGGAISFTGNHATPEAQAAATATGIGTQTSVSLNAVAAGNITICGAGAGSGMAGNAISQTLSWEKDINTDTALNNGKSTRSAASGTVTHTMNQDVSDSWATIIVEVAAAITAAVEPTSLGRRGMAIVG